MTGQNPRKRDIQLHPASHRYPRVDRGHDDEITIPGVYILPGYYRLIHSGSRDMHKLVSESRMFWTAEQVIVYYVQSQMFGDSDTLRHAIDIPKSHTV